MSQKFEVSKVKKFWKKNSFSKIKKIKTFENPRDPKNFENSVPFKTQVDSRSPKTLT
jgi:hypothetical protein